MGKSAAALRACDGGEEEYNMTKSADEAFPNALSDRHSGLIRPVLLWVLFQWAGHLAANLASTCPDGTGANEIAVEVPAFCVEYV